MYAVLRLFCIWHTLQPSLNVLASAGLRIHFCCGHIPWRVYQYDPVLSCFSFRGTGLSEGKRIYIPYLLLYRMS